MTTILSISLPAALRKALDAAAKRQRRSRSFLVGEAIREYLARMHQEAFASARDRTLREGLDLSLAERVRVSEELWQELTRGQAPTAPWSASFDTRDAYDRFVRRRS